MSDVSEFVSVPRASVEWLKKHYPALTEKAGMCERIGGRLYTKTACASSAAPQFENVGCSQCGAEFGPGNSGFSHCADHATLEVSRPR